MKKVLTIMAIVAMATVTANAGLIHQWDFEGNADDSVGSADGTLSDDASITTGAGGKSGEAVSLGGNGRVDIGGSLLPQTDFTLTAWVKPTDNPSFMYVAGTQNSSNTGALMRVDSGGVGFARTLPRDGDTNVVRSSAGDVPQNTWTHLAFTYETTVTNGTVSTDGNVNLYVNGVLAASGHGAYTAYNNFKIGARPDAFGGTENFQGFIGLIDDVRIYDTALKGSEIAPIASDFKANIISPQEGVSFSPSGVSVPLQWELINLNPADPNNIFVDVWFGTDPNKVSGSYTKVVDAGEETTTYLAQNLTEGTYYWQVDCYSGDPAVTGASPLEGPVYSFDVVADAPPEVQMITNPTMTWSGQGVDLAATVSDDGGSVLTIEWTADAVSAADPNLAIAISGGDTQTPTLTITKDADGLGLRTVTMTISATDENNPPVTASVDIDVYDDACDMTINGLGVPLAATDYNADCVIDIQDLVIMAAAWLDNYAENGPVQKP